MLTPNSNTNTKKHVRKNANLCVGLKFNAQNTSIYMQRAKGLQLQTLFHSSLLEQ